MYVCMNVYMDVCNALMFDMLYMVVRLRSYVMLCMYDMLCANVMLCMSEWFMCLCMYVC